MSDILDVRSNCVRLWRHPQFGWVRQPEGNNEGEEYLAFRVGFVDAIIARMAELQGEARERADALRLLNRAVVIFREDALERAKEGGDGPNQSRDWMILGADEVCRGADKLAAVAFGPRCDFCGSADRTVRLQPRAMGATSCDIRECNAVWHVGPA